MKTNKHWSIVVMLVLMLGTAIAFSSCSKDDENEIGEQTNSETVPDNLIGTWYGTKTGTAGRKAYITFKDDKTVTQETYSRVGENHFAGTFSVSGNKVICKGVNTAIYYNGDDNIIQEVTREYEYSVNKLTGGPYNDINEYTKTNNY